MFTQFYKIKQPDHLSHDPAENIKTKILLELFAPVVFNISSILKRFKPARHLLQ